MSNQRGTGAPAPEGTNAGKGEKEGRPRGRRPGALAYSALALGLASAMVMNHAAAQSERPPTAETTDAKAEDASATELDVIRVTGTRVRGGTVPSPVLVFDAGRIEEEGFHDLGEVIRSIPQNFTGGQNPGATSGNLAGAGIANQNITGGSSLNLRGLGSDATLTLLNGRRMAYGTAVPAVDISAIPVEAVARVEIMTDGASAIYGSDAVAGVGNVVLKREHDGLTLGARFGGATGGGLGTREYTATAGTTWASGGLIATYKDASVDPIRAADRAFTRGLTPPTSVYPGSDLGSGLVSIHQALGTNAELTLDAFRTRRKQVYDYFLGGMNTHATPTTTMSFVAPGLDIHLGNDWTLSAGAAWGRDRHRQVQFRQNLTTMASVLQMDECYCNESTVYELGGEGPLFETAGGEARIAVGGGYRRNEFTQLNNITGLATTHGSDSSRFAYAELDVPLVSSANGRPGIQRLALTAAVRGEDYDAFGSVTTPKLGLIYGPSRSVTLRASTGRSFKIPTLFERHYMSFVQLERAPFFGGSGYPPDATVMYFGGGNEDLEPERARTWTASAAFHPVSLPGFEAELTLFHIDFTNRVKQPITAASEALRDPAYRRFITYDPAADEQQRAIGLADGFYNRTGLPYDPSRVVALIDGRNLNASRQTAKGADLSGSWRAPLGAGELTLRGGASWMESTEELREGEEPRDLAGTVFHPPEFRARAGAVWDVGGLTASTFANHIGGVENPATGRMGGSFTSLDVTLRYALGRRRAGVSEMQFELAVQNVFDREPPIFAPARPDLAPPYDSTNYSPIGRFVQVSVVKEF